MNEIKEGLQQIWPSKTHYQVWEASTNGTTPLRYSLSCVAAFGQPRDASQLMHKLVKQQKKAGAAVIWAGVVNADEHEIVSQHYCDPLPTDFDNAIKQLY